MAKFVIRFDDISPGMAWSKFDAFEEISMQLSIPFLLGVIPFCQDNSLVVEEEQKDFWEKIRTWKRYGWTIAQHGYEHRYSNNNKGILGISNKSEFAGKPFKEQKSLLEKGKRILINEGVWEPIFMAPAHSFDKVTLEALSSTGFHYITDGYGLFPYKIKNLVAVPQLFSRPLNLGFGVYTICLHVNNMSEDQISSMITFLTRNHKKCISFNDAVNMKCLVPGASIVFRHSASLLLRLLRIKRNYFNQGK